MPVGVWWLRQRDVGKGRFEVKIGMIIRSWGQRGKEEQKVEYYRAGGKTRRLDL